MNLNPTVILEDIGLQFPNLHLVPVIQLERLPDNMLSEDEEVENQPLPPTLGIARQPVVLENSVPIAPIDTFSEVCPHCSAVLFRSELNPLPRRFSFCCKTGEIQILPFQPPPPVLERLLTEPRCPDAQMLNAFVTIFVVIIPPWHLHQLE